jgi:outer membrane receptor protein involved in Fe transport
LSAANPQLGSADGKLRSSDGDLNNVAEETAHSNEATSVAEVIVTAQKRAERLIDVPQSVTVLPTDDLAKIGVVQFRDFANTIPGLTFATAGAGVTQISLRGVTVGGDVAATTAIYVDDIPYGSSSAFNTGQAFTLDAALFDLDRIEVLRGPQGTLYGASSMGGVVKYVSKQPDTKSFSVDAQTGFSGTHDGSLSYHGAAAVNMPVTPDKLAVRASGYESHDGGYIDNVALGRRDINRSDTYGGRADVLFTPIDSLSMRLTGFLQNISRDGNAAADFSAGVPADGELAQRRLVPEEFSQRYRSINGTINYNWAAVTLTSISGYQATKTRNRRDFSATFVPIFKEFFDRSYSSVSLPLQASLNKFTEELRLTSNGNDTLEWVVGGFYNHENSDTGQIFDVRDLAGQPAPNDLFTGVFPSDYEEYATFGNLTLNVTRKFDVTAGLRLARDKQDYTQIGSGLLIGSMPTARSSEDVFTYLTSVRYRFNDHATSYLRYATGYRPGGPNFLVLDPETGLRVGPPRFSADKLKSYEAGFKGQTEDQRFGVDLAVYYIDWSDIISSIVTPSGVGYLGNASGATHIRGSELALTTRPIRDLLLTGAFAYNSRRLSETEPVFGGLAGEQLPGTARFTATIAADYRLPLGSFQPTMGATFQSVPERKASFSSEEVQLPPLPKYTLVDIRSGISVNALSLQLYVRNLFDKRAQLNTALVGGIGILQPRTIGITATTNF